MPPALVWLAAPILGWAVHSAVALPLFSLLGMSRLAVIGVFALSVSLALITVKWLGPISFNRANCTIPVTAIIGAGVLASLIMMAVLPINSVSGVVLAGPIFDHSKIAMIDEMKRLGVPIVNPFFGEAGTSNKLAYYYLWHFSAAELAVATGLSGWESDAGLTWFTVFSSLTMMMGFANWLSGRTTAAGWVLVVAATASIRQIVAIILGEMTYEFTGYPTGFGGWLFQITWAPQHVASAGCALISIFLLAQIAQKPNTLLAIIFSLVAAASFESSTWIGGITFPLGVAAIVLRSGLKSNNKANRHFVWWVAGAGLLAMAIASPFIYNQALASISRSAGPPISVLPYEIVGDEIPERFRMLLDVPLYWSAFLFCEFAAFYPLGVIMMVWLWKDQKTSPACKSAIVPFALLMVISLAVGGLLISRIGANNDLAWRGVLPAVLVLIIFTATGLARYLVEMRRLYAFIATGFIALGFYSGLQFLYGNIFVSPNVSSAGFVESVKMWESVRAHSEKDDRVANNPLFLQHMTGWPINISWALLADRRSCYAGSDLALPFVPLPLESRQSIDAQFSRVFEGHPNAEDLNQLAQLYDCDVVVVTAQDEAWDRDPFATSLLYSLVDSKADKWRIYKRKALMPRPQISSAAGVSN